MHRHSGSLIALLLTFIFIALTVFPAQAQDDASTLPESPQATGGASAADQVESWIKENLGDVPQPEPTPAPVPAQPDSVPAAAAQPGGSIDWAGGGLTFTTEEVVPVENSMSRRQQKLTVRRATLRARKALLDAAESLALDGRRKVSTGLTQTELGAVRTYLQNSRITRREETGEDGSIKYYVTALASMRGDLGDLLMPGGEPFLGGVPETIPLTIANVPAPARDAEQASYRKSMAELGGFTGLVVDARGLEANPALLPVVADPSGLTAYGPFQVSRDDAVKNGIAIYTRDPKGSMLRSRAGKSPLTVRALAVSGEHGADLVISYEDAILVRTLFKNQDVKNHCRAVIILD